MTDGFEQSELLEPRQALDEAGAQTQVVSPVDDKVKRWNQPDWGDEVPIDVPLNSADPSKYDALRLPGGVMNPDTLRTNPDAVRSGGPTNQIAVIKPRNNSATRNGK